jgi:hypothetical protein
MVTTPLWATRRQAEIALAEEFKQFADLLDEAFASVDRGVARLEALEHPFGRVCSLVVVKARNLGLGCYSLSLHALAHEAGALFRPLVECLELLVYLRSDPSRISEALEDRLPKAGVVAQRIEGTFKGLRDHLNTHASHLSLSPDAMAHLVDLKTGQLRPVQLHNSAVLRQNLRTLLGVMVWFAIEAANCNLVGSEVVGQIIDNTFQDPIEDLKRRAFLLLDEKTGQ